MKLCFLLLIIFLFLANIPETKNISKTIYDDIIGNISKTLNIYLNDIENDIKNKENKEQTENIKNCINKMKWFFSDSNQNQYSYLTKLFFDSSPNYEDIKNYYNCYNNLYINVNSSILDNLTYIIIKYRDLSSINVTEYESAFNSFSKVFGACIPKGCDEHSYLKIIQFINKNQFLIEGNINGVIDLKREKKYSLTEIIFQLLLPFLMALFILSLICIKYISGIFWSLFGCFFMICHKKKYENEEVEKCLKLNKRSQIDTINSFINISSNIEEVMPGSKESQITNEDGLQIAVGLRGIFIIGLFLGLTIQNIFITPTRIFDDEVYRQYMNTTLYSFLFFFARISQKMLYSISGFELTFKLLFYFDNQLYKKNIPSVQHVDLNTMNLNKFVEDSSSNTNSVIYTSSSKTNLKSQNLENLLKNMPTSPKSSKNQSKTNSKKFKSKSKSINEDEEEESEELEEESSEESEETEKKNKIYINKRKKSNISKSNEMSKKFFASHEGGKIYLKYCHKLSFHSLLTFHLRQSYLYFIFVFSILYFIFCQTQFIAEYYQKGSYWMMITSELNKYFNTYIIFATIFLYANTCSFFKNYYNFFIPAMNEIFFYLFGTTIIFICYKKNSRLDKYLMLIILVVIFAKILIYIIFAIIFKGNKIETYYSPSLDFMHLENYYLIQMHLLNLSYYCIGMLVGLANYSLQINSKKKKIVKEFVKLPRKIFYVIKRTYNFIFGFAIFLIFLFCDIFLYKIYLSLNIKNKSNKNYEVLYFKSIFINIFNLIDCELVIACILILTIIIFYSSYSFLRDNFNAYPWKILSRIYFPLLLTSYIQSNWFLFQFAERIDLNVEGVLYVLTLIFILSVVTSIFIYVFFQVPLKKIAKLIYVENNKIIDELNSSMNKSRSASMSVTDNENCSIDLNANNTRCYINGRNLSGVSKEEDGEDNGIIKTNLDLVLEDENNIFNNDNSN